MLQTEPLLTSTANPLHPQFATQIANYSFPLRLDDARNAPGFEQICVCRGVDYRRGVRTGQIQAVLHLTVVFLRMTQLHNNLRHILKQRDQLKERVAAAVESHGEVVDETLHDDLTQIMQTEGKRLMESAAPGSLQRVFFQQQLESSSKNDARGMRWHPLMIRWCIYLCHQSQGAYETLCRVE